MTHHLVYITVPTVEKAREIGGILVEKRLVACANILPQIESVFRWEGEVQSEREALLIAKAPAARFDAIREAVTEHHPYECPCVVALPMADGHPAFMRWIDASTSENFPPPTSLTKGVPDGP